MDKRRRWLRPHRLTQETPTWSICPPRFVILPIWLFDFSLPLVKRKEKRIVMWRNASWISRQVRRVKQEAHANSELKRRSAFPRGKLNNCCFAFFEKVEKSGPFNQRGRLAWTPRWSFVPAWASLKLVRQQPLTPCSDPTFSRTLASLYSDLTYSLAFSVGYCEKRMRN